MLGTTVCLAIVISLIIGFSQMFFRKKWDPRSQHCYVTGGSSGTGLALAILLTKKGADVSIVARNEERLQKALAELEKVRQTPNQILKAYSFSVDTESGATAALDAACEAHGGQSPDATFLCAGKSTPGYFVEQDEASLRQGMDETYWAQAFSALAAAKHMVRQRSKGKIVFVSSVLGYMSIIGYSPYSPGKFAIRGLAETLQSEMMLYGIDVHICFPCTIFTPSYVEENRIKPKVTLKIEETDSGDTPETVAAGILRGVQKGRFHITYNFLGDVFRASTCGSSPRNSYFIDLVYGLIGYIALPIWRLTVDSTVRSFRQEHQEHLAGTGFLDPAAAKK
ncbi:3-ketodihydrosphingosine reductase TSC10 [Grifola frondosa]|uniref:3-dehydrosphinganine reductase n=1 Tax=Grifola frondosa TaxID=5627 RepID=A0A1C7LZD8_GRIFR|nr:3-ketodihydrosphingosine reductase TSC10 [Grifola frondosa]